MLNIVRNKTNPYSHKMQKHDVYVQRDGEKFFENLRSGHRIGPILASSWVKKEIATII